MVSPDFNSDTHNLISSRTSEAYDSRPDRDQRAAGDVEFDDPAPYPGEELEAMYQDPDRRAHRGSNPAARRKRRPSRYAVFDSLTNVDASSFERAPMTYTPARYETGWLNDALGPFLYSGVIVDVLRLVKGGKEASVYLCQAQPALGVDYLAAKVFRPRQFRNLRNDSHYRQGRWELGADGKVVKDSRGLRAIKAGTQVGQAMRFDSWLAHEYGTLEILRAAGCAVPQPIASGGHTILMSYVGDGVRGAPTLSEVRLSRTEAGGLFAKVMSNIELMLGAMRIHGDLSAYNILYWDGDVTIIDFPQAVDPYDNPAAREIFDRDVLRVCQYFAAQGVREAANPASIADDMWSRHMTRDDWREVLM